MTLIDEDLQVEKTWRKVPSIVRSIRNARPCLVNIYPKGPNMGARHLMAEWPVTIGRSPDCEIHIDDCSVSRCHARIEPHGPGYRVIDQGSTNGTFVNDAQVQQAVLCDGDSLRIGNGIFRYLAGGNVEADYHQEIYRLTIIDALTGIFNKRYLTEFLDREVARAARHHRPLTVLFFDIDHFKAVNDALGHLAGDAVLRGLAARLKECFHPEDCFARYGGEEFAAVLVETPAAVGAEMADLVRNIVAATPFCYGPGNRSITISLGVAGYDGTGTVSADKLLRQADNKLYQAKNGGRNRVVA